MKYILFFATIALLIPSLEGGNRNCRRVRTCSPCGTRTAAAEQQEALDAELAGLRIQLEEQVAATAAQTVRADKAEAAHKAAVTQVASLQTQLKKASAAGAELTNQVNSLTEEREKLTAQIKTTAVATEDYEADPPKADDAEEAPAEEPSADNGEESPVAE